MNNEFETNNFDLKKIEAEIRSKTTITEKLDYWKGIIDKYVNEPLIAKFGRNRSFEAKKAEKNLLHDLFGNEIVSSLNIPKNIYYEHFENGLRIPEFTYWFLKFNAQTYFNQTCHLINLNEKISSSYSDKFIQVEIKRLNDFESKVDELLSNGKIDNIYKYYSFSEYDKEIEYLRIKTDYYETHLLQSVNTIGNLTVVLYADHIVLKNFLMKKINENTKTKKQNTLKKLSQAFDSIPKYNTIMNLLVGQEYCKENTYIWIDEKKGHKGIIVSLLKYLHKQGYYKDNRNLTTQEIKNIAQNTFGIEISDSTIKNNKPNYYYFKFIQPASTLKD